jgi:hypothetical protein
MIQVTGHPTNVRKTDEDELFHGFIRNVHVAIRTKVRRMFDVTLTCESQHGESFDGYDIWTKQQTAKELWESFITKSNKITKVTESMDYYDEKSHGGKLNKAFRMVVDTNTNDTLKLIYDLGSGTVTNPGQANWSGNRDRSNMSDEERNRFDKVVSDVQKNISKVGNIDFQSKGNVLIAVQDMDTGEQWTINNAKGKTFTVLGYHQYHQNYTNQTPFKITIGEADPSTSFKSTKLFDDMGTHMSLEKIIKNGRGAKLNDAVVGMDTRRLGNVISSDVQYAHPSKKDLKNSPNAYGHDAYGVGLDHTHELQQSKIEPEIDSINKILKEIRREYNYFHSINTPDAQEKAKKLQEDYKRYEKMLKHQQGVSKANVKKNQILANAYYGRQNESVDSEIFEADMIDLDALENYLESPYEYMIVESDELPRGLQDILCETINAIEYYDEKSHGKLKWDFRKAYDYNTGHPLKIVYDLKGINITDVGDYAASEELTDKGIFPSGDNLKRQKADIVKDIQKNIYRKGNNDHVSNGQKVLAIIDTFTNQKLNSATIIGPFNNSYRSGNTVASLADNNDVIDKKSLEELHNFYEPDPNNKEPYGPNWRKTLYVHKIKVGEIDNSNTFKSTHFFKRLKSDKSINDAKYRAGSAESLRYGRGVKMDDIEGGYGKSIRYKHPSKKDIKRNPEAYKHESYDTILRYDGNELYEGSIYLGSYDFDTITELVDFSDYIESQYPTKSLVCEQTEEGYDLYLKFTPEYSQKLWSYLENNVYELGKESK